MKIKLLVFLLSIFFSVSVFTHEIKLNDSESYKTSLATLAKAVSDPVPNTKYKLRETKDAKSDAYIVVPVYFDNNLIKIVLKLDNLYIEGFIANNNKYYYFINSTITSLPKITSESLGYSGNYISLGAEGTMLNRANIEGMVANLARFEGKSTKETKLNLVRLIFVISESIRFSTVTKATMDALNGEIIQWNTYEALLKNYDKLSKEALAGKKRNKVQVAKR